MKHQTKYIQKIKELRIHQINLIQFPIPVLKLKQKIKKILYLVVKEKKKKEKASILNLKMIIR